MILDLNYFGKIIKNILILGLYILGIYFCVKIALFYSPFLIAFIIALMIEPLIRKIMKKCKLTRKISSIIVFILAISIIIAVLVWGISTLISETSNVLNGLNSSFENGYKQIQNILSKIDLSRINLSEDMQKSINDSLAEWSQKIFTLVQTGLNKVIEIITSIPTMAIYVVITILALYFISTDKIYMLDQLEHHLPPKWVKKIGIHIREISKSLGCYIKAEGILVLISFFISLVGLYIFKFVKLEVEYPLLIALGIAFVDALPIFGSGTVMIPWAIIEACNGKLNLAIGIFVLWLIMSIVRQVIEPKIVSRQIGIHPIFTLIAMYTGFRFIGVIGLLVGPILLIILKSIFSTLIEKGIFKSIVE